MAIIGVPGSGKSSTAKAVCARLNARGVPAATVPMDGFHYYRSALGCEGVWWAAPSRECNQGCLVTQSGQAPIHGTVVNTGLHQLVRLCCWFDQTAPETLCSRCTGGSWTRCQTQNWRMPGGVRSGRLTRERTTHACSRSKQQVGGGQMAGGEQEEMRMCESSHRGNLLQPALPASPHAIILLQRSSHSRTHRVHALPCRAGGGAFI